MGDWDDDDFDVTAGIDSKLVDLGLDKKKDTPVIPAEKSTSNGREAEIEGLEAARESDLEAGMLLLGLAPEVKKKTFETLKTKKQFEDYAEEVGESYKSRVKDPNYMAFALPVIKHMCCDMTKIQLEEVQAALQEYLNVFLRKEAEAKKVVEAKKQQKQKKAAKKALEKEDMVVDEYADYEENYF